MDIRRPRGTEDVIPEQSPKWQYLESTAREIAGLFGYEEVRTPILEHSKLFTRTVGEVTDIVEKEMYTFTDRGDRSITLRAEGTAPAARLYIQENLHAEAQPVKLCYVGWPIFRYERPQAGRLRQHHQFGVECFGSADPAIDAEIISLAFEYLAQLGISGLDLHINSIGCPDCRPDYLSDLKESLQNCIREMCSDCQRRMQNNPLRILDCKREKCRDFLRNAPLMSDYLCDGCAQHDAESRECLDELEISYVQDPTLVRGLDYYTKTVFEITHDALGAKDVVCGGGRYDGLVELLGGESAPGIGFGMGLERLLMILEEEEAYLPNRPSLDVFVVTIGERASKFSVSLLRTLRQAGISCDMDYLDRSVRAQMRYADKYPAQFVIMIGENELKSEVMTVRNMKTGDQSEVEMGLLVDHLLDAKKSKSE